MDSIIIINLLLSVSCGGLEGAVMFVHLRRERMRLPACMLSSLTAILTCLSFCLFGGFFLVCLNAWVFECEI